MPALLDRVRKAEVPSPRKKRCEIFEEFAQIVLKACAKEPEDRFQNAIDMSQALSDLLYRTNPTFSSSRLAQLMGTLFPEEVKRHSQVLKLPTAEEEAARRAPDPSEEHSLPAMSRAEFGPAAEARMLRDKLALQGILLQIIAPLPGESIDSAVFGTMRECDVFLALATNDYGADTGNTASTFHEVRTWKEEYLPQGKPLIPIRMVRLSPWNRDRM